MTYLALWVILQQVTLHHGGGRSWLSAANSAVASNGCGTVSEKKTLEGAWLGEAFSSEEGGCTLVDLFLCATCGSEKLPLLRKTLLFSQLDASCLDNPFTSRSVPSPPLPANALPVELLILKCPVGPLSLRGKVRRQVRLKKVATPWQRHPKAPPRAGAGPTEPQRWSLFRFLWRKNQPRPLPFLPPNLSPRQLEGDCQPSCGPGL